MTENPVTAARAAITGAGRPLSAREAVLIAASAQAAVRDPADRDRHRPTVGDVIADLRDAATASVMNRDPLPAVRAIRTLLADLGVDNAPAPRHDHVRPAPHHPADAAADPHAYREATAS